MTEMNLPVISMELFGADTLGLCMSDLSEVSDENSSLRLIGKSSLYMIFYLTEANGCLSRDHSKVPLHGAQIIVITPGSVIDTRQSQLIAGQVICFTQRYLSALNENHFSIFNSRVDLELTLNTEQTRQWESALSLLWNELNAKDIHNRVLASYFNICLVQLERWSPVSLDNQSGLKVEKIQAFERLVEERFVQERKPSAYADMLHISPNYLNRVCKEITGETAGAIIRKRVYLEAQRLLNHTSMTVNQVADRLGFEDSSYFITFFKKNGGLSPEQYRSKFRKSYSG